MDETLLSKIINGYREPDTQVRKAIAHVLEIDEAWLFTPADRGLGRTAAAGEGGKTPQP